MDACPTTRPVRRVGAVSGLAPTRAAIEALGVRLRDLRRDAALTGRQLARQCGWQPSKVSKLEYGKQTPTESDIRDWCLACGFPSEIPDLISAVRTIDAQIIDWRRTLRTGTRPRQRRNVAAYERTTLFRIWEPAVIPGLVQTAEYAHGILSTVVEFYGIPDDIEEGVAARLEAQRVLHHGDRRFLILIGEAALHTRVGDSSVMRAQLAALLAAVKMPRLSLGIVPQGAPYNAPRNNNFTIYDNRSVTVATYTAELTLTQRHEIQTYERAFDRLMTVAVHGREMRTLVESAIQGL